MHKFVCIMYSCMSVCICMYVCMYVCMYIVYSYVFMHCTIDAVSSTKPPTPPPGGANFLKALCNFYDTVEEEDFDSSSDVSKVYIHTLI